jgi:hypothetical protein
MPMVMNAQKIAANTEAIWVREESVIVSSFRCGRLLGRDIHRTIPVMQRL